MDVPVAAENVKYTVGRKYVRKRHEKNKKTTSSFYFPRML